MHQTDPKQRPSVLNPDQPQGSDLEREIPAQSISECTTTSNKVMDTGPELTEGEGDACSGTSVFIACQRHK